MTKVLIIQGAGLDVRGTTHVDIFGPETLDEINARIRADAAELSVEVDIFQSNDESRVIAKLETDAGGFDALVINPGGFTTTSGPLPAAIAAMGIPAYEVHGSNPSARGVASSVQPVCKGSICGFGYAGYGLALRAIRDFA